MSKIKNIIIQINKCITSVLVAYGFSHFGYKAENNFKIKKNQKNQKTPQQPKNKQANKQVKQQQQFDEYS